MADRPLPRLGLTGHMALASVWILALSAWLLATDPPRETAPSHPSLTLVSVAADDSPQNPPGKKKAELPDDGRTGGSASADDKTSSAGLTPAAGAGQDKESGSEEPSSNDGEVETGSFWSQWRWLVALVVGITIVLGLIIGWKLNAFLALITAATVVSLMAAGPWPARISRVAEAFGTQAGKIGLVIAMAAVIGKCMLDSGAADRIVRSLLKVLGDRLAPVALMLGGFILAIPVFFDTVFYLLVPLARSLYRRTGKDYVLFLLAITAGGAITHTLVPPTPGPMAMAGYLGFPVGTMILIGALIAAPAALAGLGVAWICNRWMPLPMRPLPGEDETPPTAEDDDLPSLWLSLAPVVLPVLLISLHTLLKAQWAPGRDDVAAGMAGTVLEITAVLGNPNLALMISTAIALWTLVRQKELDRSALAHSVEVALMSGGVIILITASGGAFGEMLKTAGVGDHIGAIFQGKTQESGGIMLMVLGFGLAALLKVAQGSSTVAMITGASMMAGIVEHVTLPYHPVYLASAIGSGSLIGSWMNDSGFWVYAKMGGLTEVESLKTWTVQLLVMGLVGFGLALLLATYLPLVP